MTDLKFNSLKGKRRFERLFAKGTFYRAKHLALRKFSLPASEGLEANSWAICVSSKLGKAVVRNRYRRLCREALRQITPKVRLGYDIALFPLDSFAKLSSLDRMRYVLRLLEKSGLLEATHGGELSGNGASSS